MRAFEAYRFIALANVLGNFTSLPQGHDETVDEQWKADNIAAISSFSEVLLDLGMDASLASLQRLIKLLETPEIRFSDLVNVSHELQGRLQDQAQHRIFFALNLKEADFGINSHVGWETAIDRFPDIWPDVAEAGACLAMSRYAASVYHSVQITESGLVELGKFLKVKDPYSGWSAVANALENVIKKKHPDRTPFERRHFASLEQIHGTIQALKNAWRNKISHVQGRLVLMRTDFGSERAEEILMATRAFMRRLAEDLPPAKSRKQGLADIGEFEVSPNVKPMGP